MDRVEVVSREVPRDDILRETRARVERELLQAATRAKVFIPGNGRRVPEGQKGQAFILSRGEVAYLITRVIYASDDAFTESALEGEFARLAPHASVTRVPYIDEAGNPLIAGEPIDLEAEKIRDLQMRYAGEGSA